MILIVAVSTCGCTIGCVPEGETETHVQSEAESETQSLVPLLSADEEKGIYLYGIKPDGVILYSDSAGHYFDWSYSCSDYRAPRIYTGLFNNNSDEDIAVVTYTKENVEDIYIISDGDFSDAYKVITDEFNSYVKDALTDSYDEVNETVTFTVNGQNYVFDISESFDTLVFDGISYSRHVSYSVVDGKLFVKIIPVAVSADSEKEYGAADMGITVNARVLFDGTHISLTDFDIQGI